ncbi:VirB4-like conjugal transfer ATPase, CD1110 family [Intestinimonas butyriciproducens]|uniref:VirB4-like conjugal transfer ATPase, CD1110 family n=1 Tax=Intestinimonas butyriciproducens TaxID=1297617 RepID=UPI000E316991
MKKVTKGADRSDWGRFTIPRSVQKSIPVGCIYRDGIWKVAERFSRTWRFADINYAVASHEDQLNMFMAYSGLLNSLPADAVAKITISNRRMDPHSFERTVLQKEQGDALDKYRREYNRILLNRAAESNNLVQDKYLTISTARKDIEEARTFFARMDAELSRGFAKLSSGAWPLSNQDRLRILHSFFRPGWEQYFHFDPAETMRKGHDFRDYVCPDSLLFKRSYFEVGDKVGRVLFLREYASYVKDTMLTELSDFSRDLMLSIDILPVPMGEAVKDVQNRILGVETEITRTEQRQIANNSFSAGIPYELEQFRREAKEFLDDLTTRDQRMMLCDVTLVHTAGTLEELDADTASIVSIAQKHSCELGVLNYEQEDGLNTVLPYGLRRIHARRTLTTESVAVLMPFKVQEIQDTGGLYYGVNAVSKNLLICDRKKLQNGHGFWLGVSGSGKSFSVKEELTLAALSTDDDILVVDPEREFGPLVWALGGEVVTLEPGSPHHINALAMHKGHGKEENPVILKSEFMMSVFEQLMGADKLGPKHKSILDRCTANVFRAYIKKYEGPEPTLPDFRAELLRQPEPEAQEMALALELFSDGSLDLFAHETNVDMSRRIIGFDMFGLGDHLRPLGMLVMLNALENRVVENKARGRFTRIYIDEGYLYFLYQYSAQVLYKFWKRLRKLGGMMTLITQNVEECLRSDTARLMFANSEFLVMLNQAPTDRSELARLLHISDTQLSYITNADVGCGLVKVGGSIVPFQNEFPRDTELYRLMSTTPGEK